MKYRHLGSTGIHVSAIAFGAGPVPELMTDTSSDRQLEVIRAALDAGINWFDTAATYGEGRSEQSLGRMFAQLGGPPEGVHLATKVRLMPEHLSNIKRHVHESLTESLQRLAVDRVTLLQVHNSITAARGDEPTSITPGDVLGQGGVLEAFRELRDAGRVLHFGLTGLGQPAALRAVIASREFATVQTPYHLLNPSTGCDVPPSFADTDYGNIAADCEAHDMGVFAIRVFAGGALAGRPPSRHTHRTKFFPLDLYQRDAERAAALQQKLGTDTPLTEIAVRFATFHPHFTSAILGFSEPAHITAAASALEAGPLPAEITEQLTASIQNRPSDDTGRSQ